MPALKPTEHYAEILWLGLSPAQDKSIRSRPVDSLELTDRGLPNDRHSGVLRRSCGRVTALYPRDTMIRNVRQLSIVSEEEMALVAAEIGLEGLAPSLLGATLVVRGIADFSHIPPSSRLQNDAGTTLTVDMENRPCVLPGREIEAEEPGHGSAFKAAAKGRRGVAAWVERPGPLVLGDRLRLFIPDQPAWAP